MSPESLSNFFTIILGFVGIGAVLDQVTKGLRADEIRAREDLNYRRIVGIFYRSTFGRYLPTSPFSSSYIIRVSFLATIILILTTSIIFWKNSTSVGEHILPWKLSCIIFITFLFSFWLTIFQTSHFIRSSFEGDTRSARLMYVIADLLTSSNLFIFIYSLGVCLGIQALTVFDLNAELSNSKVMLVTEIENSALITDRIAPNGERYDRQYTIRRYTTVDDVATNQQFLTYLRVLSISQEFPVDTLVTTSQFSSFNLDEPSFFADSFDNPVEKDNVVSMMAQGDLNKLIMTQTIHGHLTAQFSPIYASSFGFVDRVEDGFLALFNPLIVSGKIEDIVNLNRGYDPFSDVQYCTVSGTPVPEFELPETVRDEYCSDGLLIATGRAEHSLQFFAAPLHETLNKSIVVVPAYVAAMLPSLLFYFVAFSAVLLNTARGVFASSLVGRNVIQTAPFSLFGLIFGICFWFFIVG